MDKQTVRSLVLHLGGYFVEYEGETSVILPSPKVQGIFDLVVDDFDQVMLNDKIQSTLSGGLPDKEISALMETSGAWVKLKESPTLDSPDPMRKAAEAIAIASSLGLEDGDDEGVAAVLLKFNKRWELWIKAGSDEG